VSARRHPTVFPGFREMAERRRSVSGQLLTLRKEMGLSQAEVAARMGTSQSAVARFEAGDLDVRLSTVERYSTALGARLEWRIEHREQAEQAEQGERAEQVEHGRPSKSGGHGGHGVRSEHRGPGRHG
jgi:ribosome-binding protein aMBF1 (putative translation factor)